MKIMGGRIINYEAKRIHQKFELCCIAEENAYPKSIKAIVENVMKNLKAVQKKEEYPNWEGHEVREVKLDREELPKKGMIDIAEKILNSESKRARHKNGWDM